MILYHKNNLVYTIVFLQLLIFKQNNSAQTFVIIFFTSRHYYFFEKLKIVEKQLCKLNCSYGKVSHTLKSINIHCPDHKKIGYPQGIHYMHVKMLIIINNEINNKQPW